jgi:hypothetical protein
MFEEHKHKNEQVQKIPNKGVTLTHAHKWKDDKQIFWKGVMTKEQEAKRHKRNEQKEKVETANLLLFKVPKIWPYTRWCWKHLLHLDEVPANQGGHTKQFEYHGSQLHN